ncbi:acyl-CoA thioester hydrolase, YbgC/YbaW family [Lachnospiraceae bacterium YSD2013]|jgi:YbgC/YbaW family acyl-CoA thioester hydrolase|nr:acyl-CoA thioester hydrolase, YbgC/YbaW family [Lachnospiraceae bacterium YSD2013]
MVTSEEIVNIDDIDPYGMVHHSIYFRFYEHGIFKYLCKEKNQDNVSFVIREADMKYISSTFTGNSLKVITECKGSKDNRYTFKQSIERNDKTVNSAKIVVDLVPSYGT